MKSAMEWKNEGNQAFKSGDYEKAIELYGKAIETDSTQPSFYSNRCGAFINLNKLQEALEDANKCIEVDPNFIKGYSRKGVILEKMGKKEEALKVYDQGLQVSPENQDLLTKKNNLSQQAKFDIGQLLNNPMIQQMMQKNPQLVQQLMQNPQLLQNPQLMQQMMNMFAQQQTNTQQTPQQETQQSPQESTQKQSQDTPQEQSNTEEISNFDKIKQEGNTLYKSKKVEEALKKYEECVKIDSEELLVRNNIAACYIYLKNYEKAMEVVNEAIKVYKETDYKKRSFEKFAKVLERKGRIYYLMKDIDNAIKFYEESLLENKVGRVSAKIRELKREKKKKEELEYINPELADKHRNQGNELYKQSKFPEAVKEYEEAVKRNPKDPKIYNNLAATFMKLVQYNEAERYVNKCLELEPQNIKALIRKGQIHFFNKEYHKSIESYKKVLMIDSQNSQAQQLIQQTQMKISQSMGQGNDQERINRAMADPEIQAIMMDPMVKIALERMQKEPQKAMEYFQDPTLGPKFQKLIQAGILKTG